MVYGIADLSSGRVKLVQAGHPHPLLIRKDGHIDLIGDGGVPIGLLPDAQFEQIDVQMEPGDRLLLYSDGLTECRVDGGQLLDDAGLLDMVRANLTATGREFLDDLFWRLTQRMTGPDGMDDDMSATLFEYNGADGST